MIMSGRCLHFMEHRTTIVNNYDLLDVYCSQYFVHRIIRMVNILFYTNGGWSMKIVYF